jgi:hypothetical protein
MIVILFNCDGAVGQVVRHELCFLGLYIQYYNYSYYCHCYLLFVTLLVVANSFYLYLSY